MEPNLLKREWLDTNGLGGYASSTVIGCHTRKYHGLLVTRLAEPPGKYVLLSKLEDSVVFDEQEVFLTAHQYPGVLFPRVGLTPQTYLDELCPTVQYDLERFGIKKEIAMVHGHNTVLCRYTADERTQGVILRVKPLTAYRDFHQLTRENLSLRVRTFPAYQGFVMSPYAGMPSFFMQCDGKFQFFPAPVWYQNFEYEEERYRGFEFQEDLFCPGVFEIELCAGQSVVISASTEEQKNLADEWASEMKRRSDAAAKHKGSPLIRKLKRAADQFVVVRPDGRMSIAAGYHWFLEWGRDAMISLPGLLLSENRTDDYIAILSNFAREQKRGIIPNFLGEGLEPNAYNTADAGLWFGWAVQQYIAHTKDSSILSQKIGAALVKIYRAYRNGTDHGIKMQSNHLLKVGSPYEQVTWMDAMIGDKPVTPRWGCPVEINALWYNFTCFLAEIGDLAEVGLSAEAKSSADVIRQSFNDAFWVEEGEYLADLNRNEQKDVAIRPNQIFAVSLPYSPLSAERAAKVVDKVRCELWTPYGLRTLSPSDPAYRPRYEGSPAERAMAYHNGTVWEWLIGHYAEARIRTATDRKEAAMELDECLKAMSRHVEEACLGSISEIFDGEYPHEPRGSISQAWSVAEMLRAVVVIEKAKSN
jgi:predicted glycogen debranching enzyme